MNEIKIERFKLSGDIRVGKSEDGHLVTFPTEGGRMTLTGEEEEFARACWEEAKYLVLEVTGLEEFDLSLILHFGISQDPTADFVMVNVGALPGVRTKIAFPLSALDSQSMFIPRTPGRLKAIVLGKGVALEEVIAVTITAKKCHQTQKMLIHKIYLTKEEPDYTIDSPPILDSLGQNKRKEWTGKTKSLEELAEFLTSEYEKYKTDRTYSGKSVYGGDLTNRYEATGYFRTHFDGKRWCLVDPDGYRFISTGVDCCVPGQFGKIDGIEMLHDELPDEKDFPEAFVDYEKREGSYISFILLNSMRVFGENWREKWTKIARNRLVQWGFNTIGNWSNLQFIRDAKLPYVWPLVDFPETKDCIFRDFPDVYAPEYETNANTFAEQLKEFVGDPYMIGYFLRNEPNWAFVQNLLIAEELLKNPTDTYSKREYIRWLKEKYGAIAALNIAWKQKYAAFEDLQSPQQGVAKYSEEAKADIEAFSRLMIRRYVELPSKACKAVDPSHLNMGMRYAMLLDPILLEGYENFDVFSINGYDDDVYAQAEQVGALTNKPVIIGEFHFGAMDAGMMAAGISSVLTQRDRGLAYRMYYEKGLNSPYFVGAHYFILSDQATLGRFDGENMQIGLVDVCNKPYEAFVQEVAAVNDEIYDIVDGKRTVPEPEIQKIPRLMGF